MLNRLLEKLADTQESLDDLFVASALAQAGEPELAREYLEDATDRRHCCGAIYRGEECPRPIWMMCRAALEE